MLEQLLTRTATLIRRTATGDVDGYGNVTYESTEVEVACEIQRVGQQFQTGEDPSGQVPAQTLLGIFPPGTAIVAADQIAVDGVTYEVEGDPWEWRDPRTNLAHHVEATLRLAA